MKTDTTKKRPRQRASCGTISGHSAHSQSGEEFCDACRAARREYDSARRGKKRPRQRASCGTLSGYSTHSRQREEFCDECRAARRRYDEERAAARKQRRKPTVRRASCGTVSGYTAHSREREEFCDECRAARREYERQRRRSQERQRERTRELIEERRASAQATARDDSATKTTVVLATPEERWEFYRQYLDESRLDGRRRASLRERVRFLFAGTLEARDGRERS